MARLVLGFAMFALVIAPCVSAIPMSYPVYGAIKDADGNSILGARVVATNLDQDSIHNYIMVTSDSNGNYALDLGNFDYDNDGEIDGVSTGNRIEFEVTKTVGDITYKDTYQWTVTNEEYKVMDFVLEELTTTPPAATTPPAEEAGTSMLLPLFAIIVVVVLILVGVLMMKKNG